MNRKVFFAALMFFFAAFYISAKERPIVSELSAIPGKGTVINVSWKLPVKPEPRVEQYSVYRSSSPIGTYYDISRATLIATVDSATAGYVDTVRNYNDYYYAVIAVVDGKNYDIILPSINSTVNGVHLKLPEKTENYTSTASAREKLIGPDELRDTPLPFLNFTDRVNRRPLPLSLDVKNVAKSLSRGFKKQPPKRLDVYVFEEDLISPDGGDDYLLFDILKNTFIQRKYVDACVQLESLLGTNCSIRVRNRATFYLGESLYYCRKYSDAVRTFLLIYDAYPALSKKWIDSSLDLLKLELD